MTTRTAKSTLLVGEIRRILAARGWSQERLAQECRLSKTTVNDILGPKRRDPHLSTVERMAEALGVPFRDLFEGEAA